MGVFCDRLNLGSTAALDCRTGQNSSRCLIAMRKSDYVLYQSALKSIQISKPYFLIAQPFKLDWFLPANTMRKADILS